MKKCIIFIGAFVAISTAISSTDLDAWKEFKTKYSKHYANETEENHRMNIYLKLKKEIDKHNELYEKGLVSFKRAVNKYSDLTSAEIASQRKGLKLNRMPPRNRSASETDDFDYFVGFSLERELPKGVDWRQVGAVSPVKDQGHCGCCWAFGALGAVESQLYIKKGLRPISLSAQNLIDCSSEHATLLAKQQYKNTGCDGGWAEEAFQYIKDHGIDPEVIYPFDGDDFTCKHYNQKSKIKIRDYKQIPIGNERKLREVLAYIGPVTVNIDASDDSFNTYKGDDLYDRPCSSDFDSLDHVVLAVGYGTDKKGRNYYILKNSYGSDWGDRGYMYLWSKGNNPCGIATEAFYPVL